MSNDRSRKSSLTNRPAAAPREDWQPTAEEGPARAEPEPTPKEASPQPRVEKKKRPKVSFYADEDEQARANAAWLHTAGHTGHKTLTSFLETAMIKYARELESEYNDSKPFI